MSPTTAIHRSNSRPQLDVSRAVIQANSEDRNPTILLPNQSDDISHLALDIGGLKISNFDDLIECLIDIHALGSQFVL